MKKKLLWVSLICFCISVFLFIVTFFFFHFVTREGISTEWHAEAGKPLLTNMIAILSVLCFFAALICLILALVVFKEKKDGK